MLNSNSELKTKIKEIFFDFEKELIETRNNELKLNIIIESKKSEKDKKILNQSDKLIISDKLDINSLNSDKHVTNFKKEYKTQNLNVDIKSSSLLKENKIIKIEEKNNQQNNYRKSVGAKFKNDLKDNYIIYTEKEWKELIESNSLSYVNHERLIFSLSVGINDQLRGKIWMLLSKALNAALNHDPKLYYKLLNTDNDVVEKMIINDLNRTIMRSEDIRTAEKIKSKKQKLFNILKAYAIYDPQVSYCQGTNYIVAMLLGSINSERACFWTFVQIMNNNNWRDMFVEDTPKLIRLLKLFENLLQKKLPHLYSYLEQIKFIHEGMFIASFTHFFVSIFSYNIPIEYSNRVMDMFWIMEEKALFDCLIHLLKLQENKLKVMETDDLVPYLRNKIVNECIEEYGLQKSLPF